MSTYVSSVNLCQAELDNNVLEKGVMYQDFTACMNIMHAYILTYLCYATCNL